MGDHHYIPSTPKPARAASPGQSHFKESHLAAGRFESSAGGHGQARRLYVIDYRNILSHREAISLGLKARTK